MRKDVGFFAIWVLPLVTLSGHLSHAASDPRPAMEMYRQERERAATVTIQDVGRFIFRTNWGPGDGAEARIVVQAAGNSGNKEFRPVLKRAAEAWSKAGYKHLAFVALHNLWKLGEPPEYFLDNVRGHERNPTLAVYSALVWGRDASEETLPELARIKEGRALDSPVRNWAYPLVQGAVHDYTNYSELKTLREKIDMVLVHAGRGWSPLTGPTSDPLSDQAPDAYWARREPVALCKQDPELVARRVLAKDLSELKGSVQYDSAWEYLAQFLDDKADAAYRRLKPPPEAAAKRPSESRVGELNR